MIYVMVFTTAIKNMALAVEVHFRVQMVLLLLVHVLLQPVCETSQHKYHMVQL
jgi:hypothetical protein